MRLIPSLRAFLVFGFLFAASASAQWHTSLHADSALCVLPGFDPNIQTFDDGSSIVCGTLASSIFVQRLDEFGNFQWPDYVEAHHNDSTDTPGGTQLITDGDGGVIMVWADHRGASSDENGYINNALYIQRVDKLGNVRWQSGGIQVAPAYTGQKGVRIVDDGQGGVIALVSQQDFYHPGSTNTASIWGVRYNSNGDKLWETKFDSATTADSLAGQSLIRAGNYAYATVGSYNGYSTLTFDLSGDAFNGQYWTPYGVNTSWDDSILFRVEFSGDVKMTKIGSSGDTIWVTHLPTYPTCAGVSSFRNDAALPDGKGGIFYLYVCGDTVFHVDAMGDYSLIRFPQIDSIGGYVFPDGQDGVVAIDYDLAGQRWDANGEALWPSTFRCLVDPENAYFRRFAPDHRGGIIATFWTTSGCIRVQHTGRTGAVGIVTSVGNEIGLPDSFELRQNYPNPFNPQTTIEYALPLATEVRLIIYDILGRQVQAVVDEWKPAGNHRAVLDFSNLPSGVYFYCLTAPRYIQTRKMLLVR